MRSGRNYLVKIKYTSENSTFLYESVKTNKVGFHQKIQHLAGMHYCGQNFIQSNVKINYYIFPFNFNNVKILF